MKGRWRAEAKKIRTKRLGLVLCKGGALGVIGIRSFVMAGRLERTCCRNNFIRVVEAKVGEPVDSLLSFDFLSCPGCRRTRQPREVTSAASEQQQQRRGGEEGGGGGGEEEAPETEAKSEEEEEAVAATEEEAICNPNQKKKKHEEAAAAAATEEAAICNPNQKKKHEAAAAAAAATEEEAICNPNQKKKKKHEQEAEAEASASAAAEEAASAAEEASSAAAATTEEQAICNPNRSPLTKIAAAAEPGENASPLLLLPLELAISNLFSRLPLLDLFRARCVSKQWRDSITFPRSPLFFHPDCRRRRLVVQHYSPQGAGLAAFDPCLNRWSLIPTPPAFSLLCAAAGGIFCYVSNRQCPYGFSPSSPLVVGNPLTNQWRHLPPTPLPEISGGASIIAMTVDPVAASYKVIVLCGGVLGNDSFYTPSVYDSTTASWETRPTLPVIGTFSYQQCIVNLPRKLFCLDLWSMSIILFYDVTTNSHCEKIPRYISDRIDRYDVFNNCFQYLPALLICGSRFFMVNRLDGEPSVGRLPIVLHRPVGISKFKPQRDIWKLIAETPHDLLQQVVQESQGTDFIAASNGCDRIWLILMGSSKMLAFDIVSGNWTLLPGCRPEYAFQPNYRKAFYTPLLWTAPV